VCTPAFGAGEDTLAGWRGGGWGVNILGDARHSSVSTLWSQSSRCKAGVLVFKNPRLSLLMTIALLANPAASTHLRWRERWYLSQGSTAQTARRRGRR
jgi:hypothetical protein